MYMYIYVYIYIYVYFACLFQNVLHKIKQKDIHKISVIFRLFTNLLWINLNKMSKIVYVIRIVIK